MHRREGGSELGKLRPSRDGHALLPQLTTHRRSVGRSHGPRTRHNALGAAFAGMACLTPGRSLKPLRWRYG
jgi:hypothetical protein